MRKTIRDFNSVKVADPNDLILIDHFGVTSNVSVSSLEDSIVERINVTTNAISSSLSRTISSLAYVVEDINVIIRPQIVDLINDLNLNETSDLNFINATRSNINYLSSISSELSSKYVYTIQPNVTALQTSVNILSSAVFEINSQISTLTAAENYYLSALNLSSSLSTVVFDLSSRFDTLSSAETFYLSAVNLIFSLSSSVTSSFESVNTYLSGLSSSVLTLSSNVLVLSSLMLNLTGFSSTNLTFSSNYIIGANGINLLPDGNFPGGNIPINNTGSVNFPSRISFGHQTSISGTPSSPTIINPNKTIQKLMTGYYELQDGVEGQIVHFVPETNLSGDYQCQIYVPNARFWGMVDHIKTCFVGPFYWVPWNLVLDRLDPYDDIQPTIATAIFIDGAWNFSTGGRSWGFSQISV